MTFGNMVKRIGLVKAFSIEKEEFLDLEVDW